MTLPTPQLPPLPSDRSQPAAAVPLPRKVDPAEILSRLWQQNLPILRSRLASLDAAAQEAMTGLLTPDQRTEASDIAHKLAGSLGMFGYPQGTVLARELEGLLEQPGPMDARLLAAVVGKLRSVLPL